VKDMSEGVQRAQEILASGAALGVLDRYVKTSQELGS